jgi:serine/threonine-protein kinase
VTAPGPPKLGRYELITRIGQGGMAEVQLALQRGPAGFEKLVVVKLVHENLATQKPFVDMLLDEARVAALVKHPNVVDIYDLGEAEGRYFIAMEYLEGEPLLAVLRAGRDGQRLDVLSTARLVADTAEGLDAAHELRSMAGDPIELVHHDVSLGNIVVLYNGQVKLVDFGVAKATQSATASNKIQGKFGYMAPEKLRGGPGDRRSDIWSLGCVLWEALTLRRLFKGGTDSETMQQVLESKILAPSSVNGDVPADLDPIVLRALERDLDRRYPTAKAMAAELEDVLRRHGYAAKNDQIAKHMQSTFASHIAARKKLLQEVSSKGLASPDVVEAAFHDGTIASGTPIMPSSDVWMPRKRGADALADHTPASIAMPRRDDSGLRVAGRSDAAPRPASDVPAHAATAEAARADGADGANGDEPTEIERAPMQRRWRRPVIAIGGGAVAALALAIIVLAGGEAARPPIASALRSPALEPLPSVASPGHVEVARPAAVPAPRLEPPARNATLDARRPAEPPPRPAAPGPRAITRNAGPGPDAAPNPPPTTRPTHAAATRRVPATRSPGTKPAVDKPERADKPDKVNVDEVYRTGLQAWVHGDTKTALASYKRVIQANAGFAPAWRGMGLVHEKLGDRAAARAAFQKYLQIAPTAGDAASIRARIDAP